ncbi:MAG: hypothetical protein R6U58_08090, partial [Bacteroidales bacterium]
MENNKFNFSAFFKDSQQALLKPEEYFSTMSTEGGFGPPVIKALIYGFIAGILNLIWSFLNLSYAGGAFGGMMGGAVGVLALIWSVIGALIGLFIGAVIILILVSIASGKTDFEPIVHVQAALLVIMPVSAFMNVFSAVHPVVGSLLSLAVNLYLLWMLFNAMTKTLEAKADTSKIIMFVLGGILILFFFIGMATRRAARTFMQDFDPNDFTGQLDTRAGSPSGENTYNGFLSDF